MHNVDIRQAAKAADVRLYQIAAEIGLKVCVHSGRNASSHAPAKPHTIL